MLRFLFLLSVAMVGSCIAGSGPKSTQNSTNTVTPATTEFRIDTVATGLETCFGMDWLPDGRAIISERGRSTDCLSILDTATGKKQVICNLPAVHRRGQGGMLDVLVHPDYAQNGWIYFSYSAPRPGKKNTTVIERAKLEGHCFVERQQLFEALPWHDESLHFGCRMVIRDGYLYFTMGERYFNRDSAQTLSNHLGKVLRLHDDGRIPGDNPFIGLSGAQAAIYSYGHRNPQGLAFRPGTDELWLSEHGPQGGDEVNVILPGRNYGWPVITYGENYGGGKIGEGITAKDGMEQPLYYYVPSIAPGGMDFYSGEQFPAWQGNLFLGALAKRHLNRLVVEGGKVVREERLLQNFDQQIRLVKQGPDGYLYLSTNDGLLIRLMPK